MPSRWLSTDSSDQTEAISQEFYDTHKASVEAGTFWFERIKALKDRPAERLSLALENLPFPAAYREAVTALRAIIRDKRKAGSPYTQELTQLYRLAAMDSFSKPYIERIKLAGYNVLESIPGKVVEALPFTYQTLGHERLPLLTKTDRKWLEADWGAPEQHSTLLELHQTVWDRYEDRYCREWKERSARAIRDIRIAMGLEQP